MKENKITRKIKRLEILEELINKIEDIIGRYERGLKENQEYLNEHLQDENPDDWTIQCYQEQVEEHTIQIEEARKLITDLEKMI